MYAMIWKQNMAYWRDKAVFDRGYFDFVYKLVAEAAGKDKKRRTSLKLPANNGATSAIATAAAAPPPPASSPASAADGQQQPVAAADGASTGEALDDLMKRLTALSVSELSSESYAHQVCQLASRFFLMTFCRARSKDALPQWVVVLKRLYSAEEGLSSLWLLHLFTLNQGEWIREYLLECPRRHHPQSHR